MSVFLKPFAGLLAIVLVFIAVLVLGDRIERALERRMSGATARAIVIVAGVAVLALLSPPQVAVGVAACALVLALWVLGRLPLRESLLLFAGLAALTLLALAFYRPEPLATVTIRTATHGVVHGDLITTANGTWYVGQGRRNFLAIEGSDIRSLEVDSGPHSSRPIFRRILNALGG
jgi:hypothetical protein